MPKGGSNVKALETLGASLGRCLADTDNLRAVYLPAGVPASTAEAIVREANRVRLTDPPFAVLVSEIAGSPTDPSCLRVWPPENLIQYRQGDRLAVASGRHSDLQSVSTAFAEVLGLSYPQADDGPVELARVSRAAIDVILEHAGFLQDAFVDRAGAAGRLCECLKQLRAIHQEYRSGDLAWNAQWFAHANAGLDRLGVFLAEKTKSSNLSPDDIFSRYLFAAFSLPNPGESGVIRATGLGRAYAAALDEFWSDSARINTSIGQLRHHPQTIAVSHALEAVGWDDFDRDAAGLGSPLLALMASGEEVSKVVDAFSELTPDQFFNPSNTTRESKKLLAAGLLGESLSVLSEGIGGPFLLTTEEDAEAHIQSQAFRVLIPTLTPADELLTAASGLSLSFAPALLKWAGALEVGLNGELWAVGRFQQTVASSRMKPLISGTLSISVPEGDPLKHTVQLQASCQIQLLPPTGDALIYYRVSSAGLGKATYVGPEERSENDTVAERTFTDEFPEARLEYRVVVWTGSERNSVLQKGHPMSSLNGRPGLFADDVKPDAVEIFEVGSSRFELRAPEETTRLQSPLIAAITRQLVSAERPSGSTVASIRGLLEGLYARNIESEDWLDSLGHVVIPMDREDVPIEDLSADGSGFIMNSQSRKLWSVFTDEEVPFQLTSSAEAEAFQTAFVGLGIGAALAREGTDSSAALDWPSRTSWRHLWEDNRAALDAYLDTYAALVAKAREIGSALGILWASYPFSASLWSTAPSLECSAVLISPLHPIRLAWLASVEAALWNADSAERLAGTVEGWNFPLFGPRQSSAGRMIAIPMDSGEEQIFIGWSMLVAGSIESEKPLNAPQRIGRLAAPGTAASGLNATGATSAIRSYRRMHPQISTLTVDLAASAPSSRLDEVDGAVLSQLEVWASERDASIRGGARVLDSLNREGEVPSEIVAELARKHPGMPVLWSRYQPIDEKSENCNIRLLQDSGVQVLLRTSVLANRGVVGGIPFRRFVGSAEPRSEVTRATSQPALQDFEGEWVSFERALREVENASSRPEIASRLHRAALIDDRADWTVSGESLLSPSAMAALVGNAGKSQMLWEWRPPFLEPEDGVPILERRPFVSVARVPQGFKSRLMDLLERVTGHPSDDLAASQLLGKLGSRGVGLSSLLAMGGTHAAGALGFYLTFALQEQSAATSQAHQFALPIDACDTFLKALGNTDVHGERTQRADVLVVSLTATSLTMVPVEIKFYGLDAAGHGGFLPAPGDNILLPPLSQLEATMRILRAVEARQGELQDPSRSSDAALWRNALSTLLEAGIRLRPASGKNSDDLPRLLQGVANGTIPMRSGKPVIAFFKHSAVAHDGRLFTAAVASTAELGTTAVGFQEYGAVIANSKHAFDAASEPSSEFVAEWSRVIEWAADEKGGAPLAPIITARPTGSGQSPLSDALVPLSAPENVNDAAIAPQETKPPASGLGDGAPVVDSEPEPKEGRNADDGVSDEVPAPSPREGVKFDIGQLLGTADRPMAYFWPGNTALNQMNVGVVGDLGTGKTQLLRTLIARLRDGARATQINPLSLLVFDYKEDFQDEEFLRRVGGKVLRPQRIPLNIFALTESYSALAAFQKASAFCDVLAKIYPNVGPVQRDRLITIVTDLFREMGGEPPTLAEVRERYIEDAKPDAVTGILNTFVMGEIFSSNREDLVTFDELIKDRVLIVALNDFGSDQNSKNSLVAFFLNVYYDYMRRSQKWPFDGVDGELRRLNSFLLVDEAVNIMKYSFDSLMNLMLQGREFGFGTILASQYLSHFKTGNGPNYGEPLLTWFIHKVPNVSQKQLETLGIPGATAQASERIAVLEKHQAYYSSLDFPGRFIRGIPWFEFIRDFPVPPN